MDEPEFILLQPSNPMGAWWAVKVFLKAQLYCLLGSIAMGVALGFGMGVAYGSHVEEVLKQYHATLVVVLSFFAVAAMAPYLLSLVRCSREQGWQDDLGLVTVARRYSLVGSALGILLALSYMAVVVGLSQYGVKPGGGGPLSQGATQSGIALFFWVGMVVGLAPWLEEILFRGALFGGLRMRWGTTVSAVVTTLVFVALHYGEISHFGAAAVTVMLLACLQMGLRIKSGSIYPGIWSHLAYNSTLALCVIASYLLS